MNSAATPAAGGDKVRWLGIQYLRGLAACGVVVFHYFDSPVAPAGHRFTIGQYGVDLFFVISGFIMDTIARDEPVWRFLDRRLSRIYPLYWIATAVSILVYWLLDQVRPSGTELVKSLALWPHYSEAHPAEIWPVLVPGWTLSYELYFYALFALGLLLRRPALVPAAVIALAIGAGLLLQSHAAPWRVMTNPILIEFAIGLLIARFAARARHWLAPLAAAAALAWLALIFGGHSRIAVVAAATGLVAGAVWLETRGRMGRFWLPRVLGDASYSIYLFHVPILAVAERGTPRLWTPGTAVFAALAICGSVALCIVLHFVLEKPVLRATQQASHRLAVNLAGRRGDRTDAPPGAAAG